MVRRLVVLMVAGLLVLGLAACDTATKVSAHAGRNQITASTVPGALVGLYDKRGQLVPTLDLTDPIKPVPVDFRRADANGFVVFRDLPIGSGYTVRRIDSTKTLPSDPVTVHSGAYQPDPVLYTHQKLTIGFGYLQTRDGTLLSYMVRLPGPVDKGPYPTVVEYSGYDPSNPEDWSGTAPSMRVANLLGYAAVGINLRGSGCSGGSLQLYEPQQATDGYDAVETVAAQPWVKNHKVGLVGLSYPGFMALYTAATRPPHLESVAASGAVDDSLRNLLRPGGILNTGFAQAWVAGRYSESVLATAPDWVKRRISGGDAICAYDLRSRGQNVDVLDSVRTYSTVPANTDFTKSFALANVVSQIDVPVFLSASWQDEQVGGHAPSMLADFTGTTKKHFILTNGGHAELFAVPDILARWAEFLDLYVGHKTPDLSLLRTLMPAITQQVLGTPGTVPLPFPADRFAGKTYAQALSTFEKDKPVQVLFENGGGADGVAAGLPHPSFSASFSSYPVPGTTAQRWYLGSDGSLGAAAPTAADDSTGSVDSYVSDPGARPATDSTGGGDWAQDPHYDWAPPVAGKSLVYTSPALAQTETMIGSASADLYLRSSASDTDLQVTLSEVRPDGEEVLVQSGWLRASDRKVAPGSTELQPLHSMLTPDVEPLPSGQFSLARLEIYPFAHVFRAGSKVRITVTAPGGDRLDWAFGETLGGTPTNEIAHSVGRPSSLALPVVSGVTPPAAYPDCPGLRGQPCRTAAG